MDPTLRAFGEVLATTPQVMFCAKDATGRYTAANLAFVERAGVARPSDVIGKTAHDVFPAALADRYVAQDTIVLQTGQPLTNELEYITRPDGSIGWYLTSKSRVLGEGTHSNGLVSISVDLRTPWDASSPHEGLARAINFVRGHLSESARVADIAGIAGMSVSQLERATARILGQSPKQLVMRLRVEQALVELEGQAPLSEIAQGCGFYDQSSFTRMFTRVVGVSPGAYRRGRLALRQPR